MNKRAKQKRFREGVSEPAGKQYPGESTVRVMLCGPNLGSILFSLRAATAAKLSKAAEVELHRLGARLVKQLSERLRFALAHGLIEDEFSLAWEDGLVILRGAQGADPLWLKYAGRGIREAVHETQVRCAAVSGSELLVSSADAYHASIRENFAYPRMKG